MPRECYPHIVSCQNCGSDVMTSGTRAVCPECKEIKSRPTKHQERRVKEDTYIVVSDPNKEFGYPVNAILNKEEVKWMRTAVNHALSIGMVLRNRRNETFKVIQLSNGKQGLERI